MKGLTWPDIRTENELASEITMSRGLLKEVSQQNGDESLGGSAEVEGPSEPGGALNHTQAQDSSPQELQDTVTSTREKFLFHVKPPGKLRRLQGHQEPGLLLARCSVILKCGFLLVAQ